MKRVGVERQGGRPWACALCPEKGVGEDEKATTAAFEKHYAAKHMEKAD